MPFDHAYAWIVEPLADHPSFMTRPMFGCRAIYYGGKMVLVLADREPPFKGVLVCMEREQHAPLMEDLPELQTHEVLPKWLYIPEEHDAFETVANKLIELIRDADPRIGIVPKAKKARRRK